MPPAVELLNISKSFHGQRVVDAVCLEVRSGEFFSLLGSSGCGKSTTLRLIAGFEQPDSGEIRYGGAPADPRDPAYARRVNMVFQNYALFPHMTVAENVGFGLRMAGMARAARDQRVREMLEAVQLQGMEARMPSQLSGGQQQRVALARAMATHPEIVLLDEPLGALDLKLRREMQQELKHIQQKHGLTFIYVTHDQEEALSMSDRLCVMHGGKALQTGTPEEIYRQPAGRFVAEFIGENNFLPQSDGTVLAIRPEELTILTAESPDGLSGTVVDRIYQGADALTVVQLQDGPRVKVREPGQRTSAGMGVAVKVAWPAEAAVVLR